MSRPSLLKRIRFDFLIGMMLMLPIITTLWVVNWFMGVATAWFPRDILPAFFESMPAVEEKVIQILALFLAVCLFVLIGWFIQRFVGRKLFHLMDALLSRVPLIKTVYVFLRQVCGWLANRHNEVFQEVVLLQYPREGIFSLGFVMSTLPADAQLAREIRQMRGLPDDEAIVNLFVATTPNPTSGIYLIVPRSELRPTGLDVATAVNLVMSAGALSEASATASDDPLSAILRTFHPHDTEGKH